MKLRCPNQVRVSQALGTFLPQSLILQLMSVMLHPTLGLELGLSTFFKRLLQSPDHQLILPLEPDLNCRIQGQTAGAPRSAHRSLPKTLALPFHTHKLFFTHKTNYFSHPLTFWLGFSCLLSGFPKPSPCPKSQGPLVCWGATHILQGSWTWTEPRE